MNLKFIISLVLISLLSISCGVSNKAVIFHKDGRQVRGLGKITSLNKIKFKEFDSKIKTYSFKDIEKIRIFEGRGTKDYVYIKVKDIGFKVVQILINDNTCLYQIEKKRQTATPMGGFENPIMMPGNTYTTYYYYVKRKDEQEATYLGSTQLITKNFTKVTSKYFEDCPHLVEKIQKRELRKKHIRKIVKFYNEQCN